MKGKAVILAVAAIVIAAGAIAGTYSGGTGTAEEPYRISTVANWQELIAASGDWDKQFILLNDIDFGGINLTPVAPDTIPDDYSNPNFNGVPFTGIFDGKGFTLRNGIISLPASDYVGLFGCLGDGSQIRNLAVINFAVSGNRCVGGLFGSNGQDYVEGGTITNCQAVCEIKGGLSCGGLVGHNYSGTIIDCSSHSSVQGNQYVGGLAGRNYDIIITCTSSSSVNGSEYVGGMVGSNGGHMSYSRCTMGDVTGLRDVGVFVGWNMHGTITCCSSSGTARGDTNVGGFAGHTSGGTITSCAGMGTASGWGHYIGGLVGTNFGSTITFCYSTGRVSGSDSVGGCVGVNSGKGTITSCFWDIETSGQAGSAGGVGKTTAEMKTLSTFTDAGWDFTFSDGNPPVWMMPENDYPALLPLMYSGGSGTAMDPYKISKAADWQELIASSADWDRHFILLNDIDFGGANLTPVAPDTNPDNEDFDGTAFSGGFDGNGHVLRNAVMSMPDSDFVGLFGRISFVAEVRNLGTDDIVVTGNDWVGGLCGHNLGGNILRCYTTGDVSGFESVGGLCGLNENIISECHATGNVVGCDGVGGLCGYNYSGAVLACYASGTVTGEWGLGGLCGANEGTLRDCYASGGVDGNDSLGGLVGATVGGTITFCYSAGKVGNGSGAGGVVGACDITPITGCFWDTQTSEQDRGIGGGFCGRVTGLTTAEMNLPAVFTGAGWDFVGEWANGDDDIWRMCGDGEDYPRLSWEFSGGGDMDCPDGVGMEDLLYLAGRWMAATPATFGAADANADGRVDLFDLAILSENWGRE